MTVLSWSKLLAATLQHDYPDRIPDWIDLRPSELLPISDSLAASRPAAHPPHRHNRRGGAQPSRSQENVSHNPSVSTRSKVSSSRRPAVHSASLPPKTDDPSVLGILDSGADVHIANDITHFSSYSPSKLTLSGLGGISVSAVGYGTIQLLTAHGRLQLTTVYHVPRAPNLISTHQLEKSGFRVRWQNSPQPVEILDDQNRTVLQFHRQGPKLVMAMRFAPSALPVGSTDNSLWHRRLAHINHQYARRALEDANISASVDTKCTSCILAKSHRSPSHCKREISEAFRDRVHIDLVGGQKLLPPGTVLAKDDNHSLPTAKPTADRSTAASKLFMLITDDRTNYRWVYLLHDKSDAISRLENHFTHCRVHYGRSPKIFRTDGGREFDNVRIAVLCRNHGTS